MTTVALDAVGAGGINRESPSVIQDGLTGYVPTGEFGGSQCNRAWLMFDIYHIPSDAVVSSASLSLVVDSNFLGASHTVSAYRLRRRGWHGAPDSSGVTAGYPNTRMSWDNYQEILSQPWTTPGAGDTSSDRYGTALGTSATLTSATTSTTITLDTTQIQEWLSGAVVNNGMLLQASVETASSNTLIRWKASDDATPSNRPRLSITYTSATEGLDITDGLEGYFKESDNSDDSGNGHNLTNHGATFVTGHLGNAAHFVSGSGQYQSNNDAELKPGSGDDYTCVFWARLTDLVTLYTAVSQWNAAPGSVGGGGWRVFYHQQDILDYYVLQLNDAAGSAEVSDVVGYTSGALGAGGTWIMIAVRHDAARKIFHLGFNDKMWKANSAGAHATSENWGPYTASYIPVSDPFMIGAESNGSGGISQPFKGDIDNVLYWTRWLTDEEISTTLYAGGAGLEPTIGGGGGGGGSVLGTITHEVGNLSEYSGTNLDGGNTVDAHAAAALTGSFGLRSILAADWNAKAYKDITFPGTGILAVRCQFKISAQSVTGGQEMIVLALWDLTNGITNKVQIVNIGGTYNLRIRRRDASGTDSDDLSTQPVVGTLHTLEVVFDQTTHTSTAYLDDTQVAQIVDATTGTDAAPDRFVVGPERTNGSPTSTIYYDNVEYNDARIGVSGGGGGGGVAARRQLGSFSRRINRQMQGVL